jgi:hypothetical protein
MAKKHKKSTVAPAGPAESRAAEAVTVGWLLAVMTAGVCEIASAAALGLRSFGPGLELAAGYLFFVALVVGAISLLLAVVAYASRRVPPPPGLLVVGMVIGGAPLLVLLLQLVT